MTEGTPLDGRLANGGAVAPPEAARIGAGIARALAEAHAEGVVHGTLCPRNVQLEGDRVRVLHYGIERAERAAHPTRTPGVDVHALRFMAPEQMQGDEPDAPEDLYSLGAILFTLVAGRTPFQHHEAVPAIAVAHMTEPPPRLEDVPAELAMLIGRLLDKDPIGRPSAREAAARLEAIAAATAPPAWPVLRLDRPPDDPYTFVKGLLAAYGASTAELWRRTSKWPRTEQITRGLIGDARAGFRWCEHRDRETTAVPLRCHGRTHGLPGLEVVYAFTLEQSGQAGLADPRGLAVTVRADADDARATFARAWRDTFGEEPQLSI